MHSEKVKYQIEKQEELSMSYDLMVFEKTKAPNTKNNLWFGMISKQNGKKNTIMKQ